MRLPRRSEKPATPRGLPWTASHTHPFDVEVAKPRWPPVFSTAVWLPRLKVRLTNTGGSLDRASVSAEMTRYDGDIASAAGASGWTDVAHFHRKSEQWKAGERRVFDVRVPGNKVASPGTYLLRLSITRWVPSGTPREDLLRQLEHQGESPEKIADLMQRIEASNKELADSVPGFARIDLDTPRPGQYSGEAVSTVTVLDFVRVEPFSNVLSLFGVVVGALAAIATLALVILTWASL